MKLNYLSAGTDAKTTKGEKRGYRTYIMYLAPYTVSVAHGGRNVCPFASAGCAAACLYSAGRGAFASVQKARIRKTVEYFQHRELFLAKLHEDIRNAEQEAKQMGMRPTFRLNGTSDINWGKVIAEHPTLRCYDYTASVDRVLENDLPNYHLTLSRKENTPMADIERVLLAGKNVAVVFSKPGIAEWNGFPVVDGDVDDLRFLDPEGVIVGLKAKGKAKQDTSGFVVQV